MADFVAYAADNPEIVSGELYDNLMVQIEGSENRVAVARRDYNKAVNSYRVSTRRFPGSVIAGMFGFRPDRFPYFQADEGSQTAPKINIPTPSVP